MTKASVEETEALQEKITQLQEELEKAAASGDAAAASKQLEIKKQMQNMEGEYKQKLKSSEKQIKDLEK